MLRLVALALTVLVAGCDTAAEGTLPVVQIVGADLRYTEPGSGPSLDVWPEIREVDRYPAPECGGPTVDCAPGRSVNAVLPERTRLVADRPVQIGGETIEAGQDLLPALGDLARFQLSVYPFSVASLPVGRIAPRAPVRLTASWETNDGLAFSASATVRR